ncbi:hypothetical protein MASR2M17_23370 [Aminivibrio sp.]
MASIRKGLLQLVFSGSFMKRWNDKMRPMELVEVDKQAHKMIAAWLLFELNSQGMSPEEKSALGEDIVRGGIFDYLYRLVITDIKPPIFYQIKDFWGPCRPISSARCAATRAWLRASSTRPTFFASRWEFHLIRGLNQCGTRRWTRSRRTSAPDSRPIRPGRRAAASGRPAGKFAFMCGRLRFQKRWSQTPRIPETSVLGHMFIVACLAYFFSIAVGACPVRRHNNFYAGLFHDIPELLTRDIISPVKSSVQASAI